MMKFIQMRINLISIARRKVEKEFNELCNDLAMLYVYNQEFVFYQLDGGECIIKEEIKGLE